MPYIAEIARFDGGHAEDVRTENTNECESCDNFDIFSNPHLLKPYIDTTPEVMASGVTVDFDLTDVNSIMVSGVPTLVALGRENSGSNKPQFFKKNSVSDITASWVAGGIGLNNKVAGSLVVYKGKAYCLGDTTSAHNLQKYDGTSTVTTIGTLGGYGTPPAKPFIHPEDNFLYMASGNIISSWDDSTFTATAFTLPSDKVVVSLTNWGGYLVITCRPLNGVGNSTMYLWGRDTSLAIVQESIDIGACQVNIVENIQNELVVITSQSMVGSYSNILVNRLSAKVYSGGSLVTVKELLLSATFGSGLNNIKVKKDDRIYFGFSNDTSIYVFGKNKEGRYFLSHDRGLYTGTTTLTNFSIIGDFIWLAFNTSIQSRQFRRTLALSESQTYASSCVYRTTINPGNMPVSHRELMKKLYSIQVITGSATTGSVILKYSSDGGGTWTTCVTQANASGIYLVQTDTEATGSPFVDGRELQFEVTTTGNVPIKKIRYKYDVLDEVK
jgi:hypothetical protein